jgi:amino acid transporter
MISALGAANGLIFTGSRVCSTLGADHPIFAKLGRWHPRLGKPVWSLATQAVITFAMIVGVGTVEGRYALNTLLTSVGSKPLAWEGHGGFRSLLDCSAPVFWFFFLSTGLSLFVLRFRDRGQERPFSVPLFPILPLIFCSMCAYMLYSATAYAGKLTLIAAVPVLAGLPLYWLSRIQKEKHP